MQITLKMVTTVPTRRNHHPSHTHAEYAANTAIPIVHPSLIIRTFIDYKELASMKEHNWPEICHGRLINQRGYDSKKLHFKTQGNLVASHHGIKSNMRNTDLLREDHPLLSRRLVCSALGKHSSSSAKSSSSAFRNPIQKVIKRLLKREPLLIQLNKGSQQTPIST